MSCTKCGKVGHWASQCTVPTGEWITQGGTPPVPSTQTQRELQERRTTQQQPTGCFKCGKSGHWSRDCTAPKEDWVQRDGSGNAGRKDENDAPLPGADLPAKQGVKRKVVRKPRPKLTIEDLRKDSGLKHLVDVAPAQFRTVFRGPGHEASDLRRLLDMYQHWHRQVAPALQYDAFIDGLEKMGQTHVLKMELRAMRDSVMQTTAAPPEVETTRAVVDNAADAGDEDTGRYEDDFGGAGDMEDDELVALQAEQWETAAPEDMFDDVVGQTAPAPAAAAVEADSDSLADDAEIEELLAAAEAMPLTQPEDGAAGAALHPAAVTASQAEMEELLAIAEAMDDSPPDANEMAAAPGPVHMSATQEREEEELLALAAMSDGEDAAEPGEPGDGGASATQSAAEETLGDSTAAAQSAVTDAAGAAVDDADARPTPADLQAMPMDDMQDPGMANVPATPAGVPAPAGVSPAEDAAVEDQPLSPAAHDLTVAPLCGSLVPPDVDLADVDDEELLQMALA